jgi:hypothetical protein
LTWVIVIPIEAESSSTHRMFQASRAALELKAFKFDLGDCHFDRSGGIFFGEIIFSN